MPGSSSSPVGWLPKLSRFLKGHSSLSVIIAAAILLQALSAVQYYYTRSLLADELERRAESEITTKVVVIVNTLHLAENSLMGHVWDLKRNILHPDSSYRVMDWVLKSHPNLSGCWVAYVPDYFPERGHLFEPYAWWDHGEIRHAEIASEGRDYTQNRYYKAVYESDVPMWTDLYQDAVSGFKLVTYVLPIHDGKGDIVAMFGLDMLTEQLGDTLNYRHIYPSSYDFLLSTSGQLIAGPRQLSDKKQKEMDHIISMINDSTVQRSPSNSGRSTVIPFQDPDGDKGLVFYASLKGAPHWKIAVVCYDKEVYAQLMALRRTIGILMLLGIMVLGLIVAYFARNDRELQKANLKQERIGSELRIAMNIQKEMLPHSFSLARDDIDVFGSLTPAREVGGDLYDFFIRDEKLFFCIGDVSGKGVPSAMVMAVIHSLFRMASAHENHPARIMQTVNETACQGNESNMFVTLFIGVLDLPTGHLRYCDAGHDAPIVLSGKEDGEKWTVAMPVSPHLPIGVFSDTAYTSQSSQIAPGSTLFLYTDGLTEARRGPRQFFGLQRTEEVLNRCAREQLGPQQIIETVGEAVRQFIGDAEQSDDLTMLAIRYTPQQYVSTLTETLVLKNNIREVTRFSSFMKAATEKLGIETSLARQLRLAVEEAVVNVIDYAYPVGTEGDIVIHMMSDGRTLRVQIIDAGVAFDPTAKEKADTTLSAEDRQIGGLGILLVRELMDTINYERENGKNILTLIKNIKQ